VKQELKLKQAGMLFKTRQLISGTNTFTSKIAEVRSKLT